MSKIEFGKAKDATLGQCCQEDEKLGRWKRSPSGNLSPIYFPFPPDSGVCTGFIAGVKRPFMPRDPSWIFCLWEHPSSRHLLYYREPSPPQWFLNRYLNQRYKKSTSPRGKTISAAEVFTVDGLRPRILSMTPQPEPLKWFDSPTNLKIQTNWMAWSIIGGTLREGRGPK